MTGTRRIDVLRASSLWVMLAVAALVMRPMALPLAAHIATSGSSVADGTDVSGHGVLPLTTMVRVIGKARHVDPAAHSPEPHGAILPAQESKASGATSSFVAAGKPLAILAQLLGHRPRAPPCPRPKPNASGCLKTGRAFGSLERA
jgi:hypothetical protein